MGMIADLFVKLGLKKDEYDKGLDDAQKKAQGFGTSIGNIFRQISSALGLDALVARFAAVTQGIKAFFLSMKAAAVGSAIFSGAMKIVRAALISTGIGAVVVVFSTLVSYFTQTQRGAEQLERGLAGLKAIFSVLIDRASAFGEGLVKIFTGNFKEGWDKLKGSVKGVGTEMVAEVSIAMQLQQRLQDLETKERNLLASLEARRAKAAQLRQEAKEEGRTAEEKKRMLMEAASIYKSIFKDEKGIETERAAILEAQINLGEKRDEKLLELEKNKARAIEKDTEQAQTLKGLSREMGAINSALKEELSLRNEVNAALSKPMQAAQEITGTLKKKTIVEDGLFKAPTEGLMDTKLGDLQLEEVQSTMTAGDAMLASAMEERKGKIKQWNDDVNQLIASGMQSAAVTFAVGIGNLMTGDMNVGEFGATLLAAVGDFIVQFGELLIAQALASAALQLVISNPALWPAALAAGVALVAIGTAFSNLSKKGMAGGGGSGGGGEAASGYSGQQSQSTAAQAMSGQVEFILKGNALMGVMNNQGKRNTNMK